MVPVTVCISPGIRGKFLAVGPYNTKTKLRIPETQWHRVNLSFRNEGEGKENGAEANPMATRQALILHLCAWCPAYVVLRRNIQQMSTAGLYVLDKLSPRGLSLAACLLSVWC